MSLSAGPQEAQLGGHAESEGNFTADPSSSIQSNVDQVHDVPPVSSSSRMTNNTFHHNPCDPTIYLQCFQQLTDLLSFAGRKLFSNWKILLFGQGLSLLLASVEAVQSTLHLRCNFSAPAFTFGFVYLCLSFHLVFLHRQHRRNLSLRVQENSGSAGKSKPFPRCVWPPFVLRAPIWAYIVIALIEVEANYVTVLSLNDTTLTSATALKAMSIPTAIIVSRVALGRRYSKIHFVGVSICILGCILNILQDYKSVTRMKNVAGGGGGTTTLMTTTMVFSDGSKEYPHKVRGDALAILAGILLGANDVVQELLVRQMGGTAEFLGMMGWCATWLSLGQAAVLERDQIATLFRRYTTATTPTTMTATVPQYDDATCSLEVIWWLIRGFLVLAVLNYIGTARFLSISESAFLNLSMLTGDLWSVLFSIVAQGIAPRPVFYGSLICIVSGVLLYGAGPSPIVTTLQPLQDNDNDGLVKDTDEATTTSSSSPTSQYV